MSSNNANGMDVYVVGLKVNMDSLPEAQTEKEKVLSERMEHAFASFKAELADLLKQHSEPSEAEIKKELKGIGSLIISCTPELAIAIKALPGVTRVIRNDVMFRSASDDE